MGDQTVDQLVMLFSADWFRPYWSAMGMPSDVSAGKFQQACKAIVNQIVGGAETYWLASFDDTRLAETRRRFLESADAVLNNPKATDRLRELMSPPGPHDSDGTEASAVAAVSNRLASGRDRNLPELSEGLRDQVVRTWLQYRPTKVALAKVAINSPSTWDSFLRNLTPDLPTYLPDYVFDVLRHSVNMSAFWRDLTSQMSTQQKSELIAWYRNATRHTLGKELGNPSWMTLH